MKFIIHKGVRTPEKAKRIRDSLPEMAHVIYATNPQGRDRVDYTCRVINDLFTRPQYLNDTVIIEGVLSSHSDTMTIIECINLEPFQDISVVTHDARTGHVLTENVDHFLRRIGVMS